MSLKNLFHKRSAPRESGCRRLWHSLWRWGQTAPGTARRLRYSLRRWG